MGCQLLLAECQASCHHTGRAAAAHCLGDKPEDEPFGLQVQHSSLAEQDQHSTLDLGIEATCC